MDIHLDLKKLDEEGLSVLEYLYLYLTYKKVPPESPYWKNIEDMPRQIYPYLIKEGYIRNNGDITTKTVELFEPKIDDLEYFVEMYREIFPKGIKSGNGTSVRGDKLGVKNKMQWFLKTYPEISKETILQCTQNYINKMQRDNFQYITQADYFILKDKASKLANLCEDYENRSPVNITSGENRIT